MALTRHQYPLTTLSGSEYVVVDPLPGSRAQEGRTGGESDSGPVKVDGPGVPPTLSRSRG